MKDKAYAYLRTSVIQGVPYTWYSISLEMLTGDWRGPYRDVTDAENAAEDEAKQRNLDLIWAH